MERVPGKRIGTCLFRDIESGHLYRRYDTINQKQYMKCCKRRCTGSGIYFTVNNSFQRRNEHNHEPDIEEIATRQMISQLRTRAGTGQEKCRTIYEEECQRFGSLVQFRNIKRTMARWRSSGLPSVPQTEETEAVQEDGTIVDGAMFISDHTDYTLPPTGIRRVSELQQLDGPEFSSETNEALATLQGELSVEAEAPALAAPPASVPEDKWDHFAKFVASEIRSLDQEHLQLDLKKKIMAVIMEFN